MDQESVKVLENSHEKAFLVLATLLYLKPTIPLGLREIARQTERYFHLSIKADVVSRSIEPLNAYFALTGGTYHLSKTKEGVYFDQLPSETSKAAPLLSSSFVSALLYQFLQNKPTKQMTLDETAIRTYAQHQGQKVASLTSRDIANAVGEINSLFKAIAWTFHIADLGQQHYYLDQVPLPAPGAMVLFNLIRDCPIYSPEEKEKLLKAVAYFLTALSPLNDLSMVFRDERSVPYHDSDVMVGEGDSYRNSSGPNIRRNYIRMSKILANQGFVYFDAPHLPLVNPPFYFPLCLIRSHHDYLLYSLAIKKEGEKMSLNQSGATVRVDWLSRLENPQSYTPQDEIPEIEAFIEKYGKDLRTADGISFCHRDQFDPIKAQKWDRDGKRNAFSCCDGVWSYDPKALIKMTVSLGDVYSDPFNFRDFRIRRYINPVLPQDSKKETFIGTYNDLLAYALSQAGASFKVLDPPALAEEVRVRLAAGHTLYGDKSLLKSHPPTANSFEVQGIRKNPKTGKHERFKPEKAKEAK